MRMGSLAWGLVGGLMFAVGLNSEGRAASSDHIDGFKVEVVSEVLRGAGVTDIATETVENEPRLNFTLNKINYVADFYECTDKAKGCKVLQFVVTYEPSEADTLQAVNSFNKQYLFGKAVLDGTNGLMSMRMINGGAGSSKGQIATEFDAFVSVSGLLLEHMKKATVAAYTPDGKAATFLNATAPHDSPAQDSKWKSLPRNKR